MSTLILPQVSRITGLSPNEKLILWELAAFRNDSTGRCNPGTELLSERSGLTSISVREALKSLSARGLVSRMPEGWIFPAFKQEPAEPVPDEFWPSDAAINAIHTAYPHHDFNMEEAVNDFIAFCQGRNILVPADALDNAFVRNIDALLARRKPGKVQIGRETPADEPRSILALLSGRR